jgi:hypothetical protein
MPKIALVMAVLVSLTASGCASTRTAGNDFRVTNRLGFFEFRIGSAESFTMAQTYAWWNPHSTAVVRQSSEIRSGVALLEIRDVNGLLVHAKNLREQGTMVTSAGAPGMWSVEVSLDKATGSVRLQVEKP